MNTRHAKPRVHVPWLRRRGLPLAMITVASVILQAGECEKSREYYAPLGITLGGDETTGDIVGRVTVDGSPRSGVAVTVRRNGAVVDTDVTDADGEYEVLELEPGTYTVSIGTIPGADCPGEQTTTVVADDDTRVDFACTSQPTTGTVTGTVTADGSPVPGATVTLDGMTTTTDTNGMFTFTDVETGSYTVAVTVSGLECASQTTTVAADQTSTVDVTCSQPPPTGSEIAAVSYSLMGTIVGTDECGLGMTISNPGPIAFDFDPATNTLTGRSDTDAEGMFVAGQPWTGSGETTISSGTMTFTLRETIMGTWVRQGGLITLPGTLLFEFFDGTSKVCESRYDVTYQQLTASSHRFKTEVARLLPGDASFLGLRPVTFRYRAPWGDPLVPQLGLIAEDVAQVFPGAVARDPAGRPVGIAYGILRALVVEKAQTRLEAAVIWSLARLRRF